MTREIDAKRVAQVGWAITAVAVGSWWIWDTGIWAQMTTFWRVFAVLFGAVELWLLTHKYSFSEDMWAYLPERHIIGLAFGALGIQLFGTPTPRDVWYLLMGHFFFTPKRMTLEEVFQAALRGYADQIALLDKYRDLAPNPLPQQAQGGSTQVTVNVAGSGTTTVVKDGE